jgi:hypothetical protein
MKLIAKLVTACMLFTYSMGAWANINGQYSVLLKFNDGYAVQYNKIPGDTQVEALVFRIMNDYPKYNLQKDLVDAQVIQTGSSARPEPVRATYNQVPQATVKTEQESSTDWGKVVIGVISVALLIYGLKGLSSSSSAKAFPCMLPTDRARDGSMCGGRASSVRPNGR